MCVVALSPIMCNTSADETSLAHFHLMNEDAKLQFAFSADFCSKFVRRGIFNRQELTG